MPILPPAPPQRLSALLQANSAVSRAAASIASPGELLQRAADLVAEALGYPFVGIFLVDDSNQWAVLSAAHGTLGRVMIVENFKLAVDGRSQLSAALRSRATQLISELDSSSDFQRNRHLHIPNAHAELDIPLLIGDEAIGVFSVQTQQTEAFAAEEVEVLQGLAAQLALSVRNTRLHRQNQDLLRRSERRARLSQAASQVGKQVTSILNLDDLLPSMVDIICDAYGFYYAGVFLVEPSGRYAVLSAGRGEAGAAMLAARHQLEVGGHSMIGAATGLGEARIALDVGEERVFFKNPHLPYTRSEMALPLRIADKILGAITVQSIEESAFSSDDILSLQTMADQLAVAINNARLLRQLEQTHAELLRTKTFEALTAATTSAIHWIGNKALPITTTTARMQADLAGGQLDPASLQEDLEMVAENARLIVAVKENLLGPAREQQPRPAMLDDVAKTAARLAGVPAGQFNLAVYPGSPLGYADTAQLSRALANLYHNAIEAGASHIQVDVAPAADDFVRLSVQDDGQGIPTEMFPKMWAPFISSKGSGHTGLGLTAAQHVIAQMHGQISASSQPGQGATFEILLPAQPAGSSSDSFAADSLSTSDAPTPASRRVLLLCDDTPWASFAGHALSAAGASVEQRASPAGADLSAADLILVDEMLSQTDLASTLAALQAAKAGPRTLVLTAAPDAERVAATLRAGARDVVLKPYTSAEFAALLG